MLSATSTFHVASIVPNIIASRLICHEYKIQKTDEKNEAQSNEKTARSYRKKRTAREKNEKNYLFHVIYYFCKRITIT